MIFCKGAAGMSRHFAKDQMIKGQFALAWEPTHAVWSLFSGGGSFSLFFLSLPLSQSLSLTSCTALCGQTHTHLDKQATHTRGHVTSPDAEKPSSEVSAATEEAISLLLIGSVLTASKEATPSSKATDFRGSKVQNTAKHLIWVAQNTTTNKQKMASHKVIKKNLYYIWIFWRLTAFKGLIIQIKQW